MADFDIASLLANSAKTNADFDFSKLADAYYSGLDQQNKNDLRNAFKGGIPTGADGQPDFNAMSKTLFRLGDVDKATALSNLDIQRQRLKNSALWSDRVGNLEGGNTGAQNTVPNDAPALPPSLNRGATTRAQPTLAGGNDTIAPTPPDANTPTIMSVIAANNVVPNDQLGAAAASIGRQLKLDPRAPIDINDPKIRNPLVGAIMQLKKMGVGDIFSSSEAAPAPQIVPPLPKTAQAPLPPQGVQQAPVAPQPQPVAPQMAGSDAPIVPRAVPTQTIRPNPQQDQGTFGAPSDLPTRGAVPTGQDPEIQRKIAFYSRMMTDPNLEKDAHEFAKMQLENLQKQAQPTDTIKEYGLYQRQGGTLSFNDWQASKEGQKAAAGKLAEADINEQKDYIEAGRAGKARLATLNTLTNIIKSEPNINLGFGSQAALKVKMALNALGLTNVDVSGPQAMQKLNAALAVEMAKSLTARTTQFEFKTFLGNNPGLELDRKGNERLIGIFSQLAKRDLDLGRLARDNRNNWNNWDRVVANYDKQNPVRDPVTGTTLSSDSVISPAAPPPKVGDIVKGRPYLGGDLKNPKSWGPRQQ